MVTRTETPQRHPVKPRHCNVALHRKLLRDYRDNAMLFLAIVLLCALGTYAYSGLDATWRMLDLSISSYYEETNLADFWVNDTAFSRNALTKLKHLSGVAEVQPRTTLTVDVKQLEDDTQLVLHATEGDLTICTPLLSQGTLLSPTDRRGCMLDDQFAATNQLSVGDTITVNLLGEERTFTIRALIKSSEHIVVSKDVTPDPLHYGFVYISSQAVPTLPYTQVLITLEEGADSAQVEAAITDLLPTALVQTHKSYPSVVTTENSVSMFRSLCLVFPLLAFAVASMVVLTTLTRMMEKQRTQMGTLKALGYPDRAIRMHYLNYALLPSVVGALLGLFAGRSTLPYILWDMEASSHIFPWQKQAPISVSCWCIVVLAVALSIFICLRTYRKAARETTAALLRPKPPASGNRILLERVTFLWRRFSFNTKMIVRNLLRNKGRMIMSLVGILCCNMLIICTLGLTDSIHYFVDQYYEGTLQYDVRADLSSTADRLETYQHRLDAACVEGIMEKSVSVRTDTVTRTVQLTVLKENQTLLQLGEKGTPMAIPEQGAIISEKMAKTLGVSLGDTIEVWLAGDDEPITLTLTAMAYTNIGQSIYLGEKQWDALHKGSFIPTALLLKQPTALTMNHLDAMDEVTELLYPAEQTQQTMKILDSTAGAFMLLSGIALGLAFIICYNMGLMSFTERTRDYATLKVLGYHQREIRRLMLRENNITAILGVLLGIAPGMILTKVILTTCESETMVYASYVSLQSIVIASVVTFAFTWLIEWLLTRKVRSIDMVEALKSVE